MMRIILGSWLSTKAPFNDEEELETVVRSRPEVVSNGDILYIPQRSIQISGDFDTVPEAIAIDLSAEKWYIVEVELARHRVWDHTVPQVSKQVVAADNLQTKRQLMRIVLGEIEKKEEAEKKK